MDTSYYAQERPEMRAFIPPSAQRLLEIGCGAGGFVRGLKRQRQGALHATGVEMMPAVAATARTVFDRVLEGSVEAHLPALASEAPFDCIVCNDVLEHLVDPWAVLRSLRPLLAPGGSLVVSLPNVRYWPTASALLFNGAWHYQNDGVLDRTHLRFFTRSSLPALFEPAGFRLIRVEGINNGRGGRARLRDALVNLLSLGRLKDTRYLQFACVATPG
jgi:2-polyprenyl-3-methyl-5-hydroxy-6-metoxy-1,4-benzoquinol methylase